MSQAKPPGIPKWLLLTLVAGCTVAHALVAVGVADILSESGAAAKSTSDKAARGSVQVRSIEPTPGADRPVTIEQVPTVTEADAAPRPVAVDATRTEPTMRRYFDVAEVDEPASPQPDWQLDIEQLVASGVRSLNFEVFVTEGGVAERCSILQMNPPNALPSPAVAARLCSTRLTPAKRQGLPVASVRRIELMLAE